MVWKPIVTSFVFLNRIRRALICHCCDQEGHAVEEMDQNVSLGSSSKDVH